MNVDRIQKKYGYQEYHLSDNRYILSDSNRKYISITISYLLPMTTLNRYLPRSSNTNLIFTTSSSCDHIQLPLLAFVVI